AAANKELEAFSYSVSHDLRAPLRHINGFLGLLRGRTKKQLDATSLRYLSTIEESTKSMDELIRELLNFSRTSRVELQKRELNLDLLVKEVIESFQPDTQGRQIQWVIHPLPFVSADYTLLRQVFANLISNAIKYSRTRPCATIEIAEKKDSAADQIIIYIRDNGIGFDMQYANKLFGVF